MHRKKGFSIERCLLVFKNHCFFRALNLVIENSSALSGEVDDLNKKIDNLKKNSVTDENSSAHVNFLTKGLKSLESEYDKLSEQFDKLTPAVDINSNKVLKIFPISLYRVIQCILLIR